MLNEINSKLSNEKEINCQGNSTLDDITITDEYKDNDVEMSDNTIDNAEFFNISSESLTRSPKELAVEKDTNFSKRSWWITLVLCIFLGFIGFHRFYVGKAGTAILMLLTLGGFGIWIIVDIIGIITNGFTDEYGKVIKRKKVVLEC